LRLVLEPLDRHAHRAGRPAFGSVSQPLLKAEEEKSQGHHYQTSDSDAGGGGDHAYECEDKTAKGETKHDEVQRTAFSVLKLSVHVSSVRSKPVETYTAMHRNAMVVRSSWIECGWLL